MECADFYTNLMNKWLKQFVTNGDHEKIPSGLFKVFCVDVLADLAVVDNVFSE